MLLSLLFSLVFIGEPGAFSPDDHTALLMIDIQEFYFPGGALPLENPERASDKASELLKHFRAHGGVVIHVGHEAPRQVGFHADVAPRSGETVIMKSEVNAFKHTDLAERLRALEVKQLVICGMQTHMCVEAAVRAAADLGYPCLLIEDACTTRDLTYGDRLVKAADVHAATLATLKDTYARVMTIHEYLHPLSSDSSTRH